MNAVLYACLSFFFLERCYGEKIWEERTFATHYKVMENFFFCLISSNFVLLNPNVQGVGIFAIILTISALSCNRL